MEGWDRKILMGQKCEGKEEFGETREEQGLGHMEWVLGGGHKEILFCPRDNEARKGQHSETQ